MRQRWATIQPRPGSVSVWAEFVSAQTGRSALPHIAMSLGRSASACGAAGVGFRSHVEGRVGALLGGDVVVGERSSRANDGIWNLASGPRLCPVRRDPSSRCPVRGVALIAFISYRARATRRSKCPPPPSPSMC